VRVRKRSGFLLICGLAAVTVTLGMYLGYALTHPVPDWTDPVDLRVYRFGGLIAAHVAPWFNPHRVSPLYDWPGHLNLKFTYPPFAALLFTALTIPALPVLVKGWVAVNVLALIAAIWFTLGALPQFGPARPARAARAGATLLLAAVLFWTEPVQRTLYLGQIELVLMALIMWDACQPDRRWWKGAGIGLAAGIKLVPLIFIPYLLLTRKFRQAAVATGMFGVTVGLGFGALPADSRRWWLGGVFARGSRTGFVGWEGNQSLSAVVTRLAGSVAAGHRPWLVLAGLTVVAGVAAAAVIARRGYPLAGILTCALTGLLASPISWDHHWVWVVPWVAALAGYAAHRRAALRSALVAMAALVTGLFAAWPGRLLGGAADPGGFSLGLIWLPPNTNPGTYYQLGDRSWYPEYHWHGSELVIGNLYVLTGLAGFLLLIAFAMRRLRGATRLDAQSAARPTAAPSSTAGATTS
jgi:alpha-1,2-mannosyltransferase